MLKDFIRGWDDYIYHGFVPKTISFDFVPKKEIYPNWLPFKNGEKIIESDTPTKIAKQ